ncbi:MAG: phosphate ABC transporter permease [Gammaproteobacteria bacterium]|nr:MAG: phosphate ABC transporter permease [Gammaproteobacteria bacterium]
MKTSFEQKFGVSEAQAARTRKIRKLTDQSARLGITLGGVSVIFAICLIFFYLLYEVVPLFLSASIDQRNELDKAQWQQPVFSAIEEQGQIGINVEANQTYFYYTQSGDIVETNELPVNNVSMVSVEAPSAELFAVANQAGEALVVKHDYRHEFDSDTNRTIIPFLEYPYGEDSVELLADGQLKSFAFRDNESQLIFAAASATNEITIKRFEKAESLFGDGVSLEELDDIKLAPLSGSINQLLISLDQRWLYVLQNNQQLEIFNIESEQPERLDLINLVPEGVTVTNIRFLLGGFALLVGDSSGNIAQWFLASNENSDLTLHKIREFKLADAPITAIETEHRRKGFVAGDAQGNIGFYNTTADTNVINEQISEAAISRIVLSPRGDVVVAQAVGQQPYVFDVDNKHPEVSMQSLWEEVWYEDYNEPEYIWQSSSASNDFEPKFSLMPLTFGTLKAAFYAMLVAMPLAICGAIYTAYFMAPQLRTKVKPTIELMEALPTVILGFLAGLWLAPLIEMNLPGIFSILILTPLFCIIAAYVFSLIPGDIRNRVPDGWVPVILIPVVLLAGAISMGFSRDIELAFFNGDMRLWLQNDLGIGFDQRNALIVGLAMGFAVIPTIFSITEDAIFAVPKNLSFGSLALGATPWQTLVRVVLPTASPGIFSAVMIGFGRAVGETMIVLMATGNTPIMDMNIFEGLRTLSANIAVEMPEAEVDSSHFRILFLSGLVLFVFTFILNTTAETVRQRLRAKYGSL